MPRKDKAKTAAEFWPEWWSIPTRRNEGGLNDQRATKRLMAFLGE